MPEGEGSLGETCIKAGAEYDEGSNAIRAFKLQGQEVDFKSRGPPYVTVFIHVLRMVMNDCQKKGAHPEGKRYMVIREYWETVILRRQPNEIAMDVLHFKYRKAGKHQERGVLSLAVSMRDPKVVQMWEAALVLIQQHFSIKRTTGPAPRGPLEREVSRLLNELTGGKEAA